MSQLFYAYLDDFDEITIIIKKENYDDRYGFDLLSAKEVINLNIVEVIDLGSENKIITTFDAYIDLKDIYYVRMNKKGKVELFDGKIVRTPLFDSIYKYNRDDLGVTYTKEFSKFKIWSPIAKKVTLEIVYKNGKTKFIDSIYKTQGVWRAEVQGDLEGSKYRYHIYVNGKTLITTDPYAIASNINSEYNYIVDKSKFYKMKYRPNRPKNHLSSIIYETSIKDFTSYFKDEKDRSTYKMFTDSNLKSGNVSYGLKYLKKLGITHIQILPFYSFDGVDEKDRFKNYNWGYNPREYNVPSGLYSLDPDDPYERINELKKMIDLIHKAGLNVVMDVVYNHVYNPDTFPYEILCPGYAYIYNHEGMRTAYSGCKNDVNSAKNMVRKFIIDSVMYWAKEYNIDGFRFDIMGLIDIETMNTIAQELEYLDPSILVYGEGWKMVYTNQADSLSHMFNRNVIRSIGFFNDKFRESVRRYALGYSDSINDLRYTLLGSIKERYLFKYAAQSINYTECHDDMVLIDIINSDRKMEIEEAKKRSLLATSMGILSLGIPFIHAGQEFFLSKNMCHNSYNTSDEMNMVKWSSLDENISSAYFIRSLIEFRKEHDVFLYNNQTELTEYCDIDVIGKSCILYKLKDEYEEILIIYHNNMDEDEIDLDEYEFVLSNIMYENHKVSGIGLMIVKKEID